MALNHQQLLLRKYHFHYINMLSIKKLEWTVKHYHFHVELLFDSLSDWFAFSIDCLLQLKEEEFYWNNPFFSPSAECTQEKWGFPMCHYLKEERWSCGRNARMSACLVWLYFFFSGLRTLSRCCKMYYFWLIPCIKCQILQSFIIDALPTLSLYMQYGDNL